MNTTRKIYISRKRFNEAKKERKLTINKIAEEIDCPYDTIKGCLQKELIMPDIFDRICKCLNVTPGYLKGEKMEKKKRSEINVITLTGFVTSSDKEAEDLDYTLKYYSPFIDSEGNFVPTYANHMDNQSISEAKHGLFLFLDSLISSKGFSKDFFDKNYNKIYELFISSVIETISFIQKETGEVVLTHNFRDDPRGYDILERKK